MQYAYFLEIELFFDDLTVDREESNAANFITD